MKSLKIFILFFIFGRSVFATDRLYLQCDPEENCVIARAGNVKIENPACVAKRALCRIKCRNLNDDADRYIREDKNKIAIIDEELKFNQIQLDRQTENIRLQLGEIENLEKQISELSRFVELQNEQIIYIVRLIESLKSKAKQGLLKIEDLSHQELTTDENAILDTVKNIYGYDNSALQFFLSQDNQVILYQIQNQLLGNLVLAKVSLSQLQSVVTSTQESVKQIMQKMNELSEKRKKLVNHIQEQVERKCPANLV